MGQTILFFPINPGEIKVFKQKRGLVIGVEKSISIMCDVNGNKIKPTQYIISNKNIKDKCKATHYIYPKTSKSNLNVELIKVIGSDHTCPGGYQYLPKKIVGNVSKDFNAFDALWDFFKKHIN